MSRFGFADTIRSVVEGTQAILARVDRYMQALGRHWIIEFWECNDAVDSTDAVRRAVVDAVDAIGATLLHLHVEPFQPQGVTGIAVLAESHFSVHSWPEYGYLAADVFTCGETARPEKAVDVLRRAFEPAHVEVAELQRGIPPHVRTGMRLEPRSPGAATGNGSLNQPAGTKTP